MIDNDVKDFLEVSTYLIVIGETLIKNGSNYFILVY